MSFIHTTAAAVVYSFILTLIASRWLSGDQTPLGPAGRYRPKEAIIVYKQSLRDCIAAAAAINVTIRLNL